MYDWQWCNRTAYDDESLRHVIERVHASASGMHESDPYQDLPESPLLRVNIRYGEAMTSTFNKGVLNVEVLPPSHLWGAALAMHVLTTGNATIPVEHLRALNRVLLEALADGMALRRFLNKHHADEESYDEKLKAWSERWIESCSNIGIKEDGS